MNRGVFIYSGCCTSKAVRTGDTLGFSNLPCFRGYQVSGEALRSPAKGLLTNARSVPESHTHSLQINLFPFFLSRVLGITLPHFVNVEFDFPSRISKITEYRVTQWIRVTVRGNLKAKLLCLRICGDYVIR